MSETVEEKPEAVVEATEEVVEATEEVVEAKPQQPTKAVSYTHLTLPTICSV